MIQALNNTVDGRMQIADQRSRTRAGSTRCCGLLIVRFGQAGYGSTVCPYLVSGKGPRDTGHQDKNLDAADSLGGSDTVAGRAWVVL